MSYFVKPLDRPYTFRVLIEVYTYTKREDFPDSVFTGYYSLLLTELERFFGLHLSREGVPQGRTAEWSLFQNTAYSLNQITNPWASYLEAGFLMRRLEEAGEPGKIVIQATNVIYEVNRASEIAHRDILYALFEIIFGECHQVVTSEELLQAGFDDTQEPDYKNCL